MSDVSPGVEPLARRSLGPGLVALLVGLLVHRELLFRAEPLADEEVYARAFEAARVGAELPGLWYYPRLTAEAAGAGLRAGIPLEALLGALRAGNLLGTALLLGVLGAAVGGRTGWAVAGLGMALWAPAVEGVAAGNVSGLLGGLVVLAALARRPLGEAGALALGLALKPVALGVALSRRPAVAAGVAGVAVLAWLDTPHRDDFPNRLASSNASLGRAVGELLPMVPWQVVSAGALVSAALLARGRWGRALVAAWLSLPLAWAHSMVLLLPALGEAWRRAMGEAAPDHRRLHAVLCVAAATVMHGSAHFGLGPEHPGWASGLLGLAPSAAALYLAWRA